MTGGDPKQVDETWVANWKFSRYTGETIFKRQGQAIAFAVAAYRDPKFIVVTTYGRGRTLCISKKCRVACATLR